MAGEVVFSIAEGALLICLEDKITRELIDEVAKAEPQCCCFKDLPAFLPFWHTIYCALVW
jgi:hypothetical protein